MAASVLSVIPVVILFLFMQRYLMDGMTAGAVRYISMSQWIEVQENGLYLTFEITESKDVRLLHFSSLPLYEEASTWDEKKKSKFRLVELHVLGENQNDHHGSKHTGSMPGGRLQLTGVARSSK